MRLRQAQDERRALVDDDDVEFGRRRRRRIDDNLGGGSALEKPHAAAESRLKSPRVKVDDDLQRKTTDILVFKHLIYILGNNTCDCVLMTFLNNYLLHLLGRVTFLHNILYGLGCIPYR